jgi:hypothetical protein
VAECAGLENRWARKGPVSSNLTSSVRLAYARSRQAEGFAAAGRTNSISFAHGRPNGSLTLSVMSIFWLSVVFGVLSNLATGLLLATVFETLQRRRDLQRQLGELWLLATRASEAVNHSRLRKDGGAEAYSLWLALQDEWLRARHSLNFALTDEKRKQLEDSISAIYELHILNSDRQSRKFLKLHPIVPSAVHEPASIREAASQPGSETGTAAADPPAADYVDYGKWALHNGDPQGKAAFDEFQTHRNQLNVKIENLLHFDPFAPRRRASDSDSRSLPDELAQTWHFGFLFSRVWKWFFSELFYSFSDAFRD